MKLNTEAIKYLLYCIADDDLVIGHRNSEWIGFGPVLEEDIAFASMAQDCVGHSLSYYSILEQLGESNPDVIAFTRQAKDFKSCQFVEFPIGDYAFSLMRHFLYDIAKKVRINSLTTSSFDPLKELSVRISREHKYHSLHGLTWVKQLGNGSEESRLRMQSALNEALPMAFGLFEVHDYSEILAEDKIQPHENSLAEQWLEQVGNILEESNLKISDEIDMKTFLGGRKGFHTEYLQDLLDEMTVVFRSDPSASW